MVKDQFKWKCELLYYITLFVYLCLLFANQTELRILLSTTGQDLLQAARYGCYMMFIVKIAMTPFYQRRAFLTIAIGLVFFMLCAIFSGYQKLILTALVIIAAYECDAKRIMKIATIVYGIGLGGTLLLCAAGIFENRILDEVRIRYNLGFNWVTLAPIYCLFISIGYTIWRSERITWIEIFALEALSAILYQATDTRLAFLINTVYLIVVLMERYLFHSSWHLISSTGLWLCAVPAAICLAVFVVQKLYVPGNAMWDGLNRLLSGRISLADKNLKELSITLFGQRIEWKGFSLGEGLLTIDESYEYNNVDCSYIRIFFDYGVIGLLLTLGMYTIGIYKAIKAQEPMLLWGYVVVLIFCITEQWMLELSFNPFPLLTMASWNSRISNDRTVEHSHRILFRQI